MKELGEVDKEYSWGISSLFWSSRIVRNYREGKEIIRGREIVCVCDIGYKIICIF